MSCKTARTLAPAAGDTTGSFSVGECLAALAEFIESFGESPTIAIYHEFVIGSDRRLPTPAQIRSTCRAIGGWRGAVRQASTQH